MQRGNQFPVYGYIQHNKMRFVSIARSSFSSGIGSFYVDAICNKSRRPAVQLRGPSSSRCPNARVITTTAQQRQSRSRSLQKCAVMSFSMNTEMAKRGEGEEEDGIKL